MKVNIKDNFLIFNHLKNLTVYSKNCKNIIMGFKPYIILMYVTTISQKMGERIWKCTVVRFRSYLCTSTLLFESSLS